MEDLSWCTQGLREGVGRWGRGGGVGVGGGGELKTASAVRQPVNPLPERGEKKWSVLRRETVKPYVDHLHVLFVAFGGHCLSVNPLSGYFSERQSGR